MNRPVLASAVTTLLCLSGGLLIGGGGAALLTNLPGHAPIQTIGVLAGLIVIVGIFGGGGLWGWRMARLHNFPDTRRAAVVGGLAFGIGVALAAVLLPQLRALVQRNMLPQAPVHVVFTTVFVPMMFLVSTIGATALLLVSGKRINWLGSGVLVGLVAAIAFLVVDLLLDALGMRVGGPRAAERVTMLSVAFLSSAAGAFAAGAVLGRVL
ncbi:MAG TPA: hypothetical protein VIU38_01265 [Anaerolineales bacterium]